VNWALLLKILPAGLDLLRGKWSSTDTGQVAETLGGLLTAGNVEAALSFAWNNRTEVEKVLAEIGHALAVVGRWLEEHGAREEPLLAGWWVDSEGQPHPPGAEFAFNVPNPDPDPSNGGG